MNGCIIIVLLSLRPSESATKVTASIAAKTLSHDRIKIVFPSELGLGTLAFFFMSVSFAQVEVSYVLLLRDYLGFGTTKTGEHCTNIGFCIVLVQSVLVNVAVTPFGEVGTAAFGAGLLLIGQGLTVLISLGFMAGANYPLVQIVTTTTSVCFGFGAGNPALSAAAISAAGKATMGGALGTVQGCFAWTGW